MRFKITILLASSILFSCSKEKGFDNVKVLGHAATGLENLNSVYHDNSKEAVEMALSMQGCEGVEIDIQLSKDDELWLYHDAFLKTQTNGNGCISECETGYLDNLQYSSLHKEELLKLSELDLGQFKGKEGIPTISLEAVADYNLWIWHSAFGFPGSLNDLNIWEKSPLFNSMTDGTHNEIDFPFIIDGQLFTELFYLVDGIYPWLS